MRHIVQSLAAWSIAIAMTLLCPTSRAQSNDKELAEILKKHQLPKPTKISDADDKYLREVARDTWQCIASLADAKTGLPYDNSDRGENTSVSNIGIYMSAVVAARDLGFITVDDANRRLAKTLSSVEKLQTWHGFQQCWNSIATLKPADNDFAISLLDTGNFAAALMTVETASPLLAPRCRKLLDAMEWKWFYDAERGLLRGGFDTKKNEFTAGWYLDALGTDARLCQFIAIATNAAPPQMWDRLTRRTEERYDIPYLWPGWQGGGLFMQYINGLWLDERNTPLRQSADNFAAAQMRHAKEIGSPVWGWSASASPDGEYLGWGKIEDEVVTPHACVLAIDRFPAEVVANLRALELLNTRRPRMGFVDAVDWKNQRGAEKFLVLDQSMLLISIANHLESKSVRYWFSQHDYSRAGREKIAMFKGADGTTQPSE